MCGECTERQGLHVPEDLVHLDIYDPFTGGYVEDGECGRIILTTLLNPGEKCGNLLINYDTEDTTVVISKDKCACGRTHMRILNPQREAETFWINGTPFNRVEIEKGIFQRENMEYLSGEYEAFLYEGDTGNTIIQINAECLTEKCDSDLIEDNFVKAFFEFKPPLLDAYQEGGLEILFSFRNLEDMEFSKARGRPKRVTDRR
jgi:phenylacetate-coenzyme A ligase PaaK-like adenylate-forming protein